MYGWSSVSCVNNIESMSMCGEGTWDQTLHMNKLHIVPTHPELAIFLNQAMKASAMFVGFKCFTRSKSKGATCLQSFNDLV